MQWIKRHRLLLMITLLVIAALIFFRDKIKALFTGAYGTGTSAGTSAKSKTISINPVNRSSGALRVGDTLYATQTVNVRSSPSNASDDNIAYAVQQSNAIGPYQATRKSEAGSKLTGDWYQVMGLDKQLVYVYSDYAAKKL